MNPFQWRRLLVAAGLLFCMWSSLARAQNITLVNATPGFADQRLAQAVPGLQRQLTNEFADAWGVHATLSVARSPGDLKGWTVTLTDGGPLYALGYHGVGRRTHRPFAVVNVDASEGAGVPWTVVASHELTEMLVDPWLNQRVQRGSRYYWVEVADPVERETYDSLGTEVSDFVTPAWYSPLADGPYDWLGRVTRPFQLLPGGYDAYVEYGHTFIEEG